MARAQPFASTRRDLEQRRAAGYDGGMQFTYRNPARSTDPARTLDGAHALVVGARAYARQPPPVAGHPPTGRVAAYAWRDHYADLRDQMVINLRNLGMTVERAHHEVGTAGQAEINYRFSTLLLAGD